MLPQYTMTLIRTEDLRQTVVKSLPARYIERVLSMGKDKRSFSQIGEEFLYWCQFDKPKPIAKTTLESYKKVSGLVNKHFGDIALGDISMDHVNNLRKDIIDRGCSLSYLHRILLFIRLELRYAIEELQMDALLPQKIKLPPKPRADVVYLSDSELERIFSCIDTTTIHGVRLKAVITTILDTGMRISEVMSLNRDTIDWGDKSAYIIGKGDKKAKVFFQDWSLWWIQQYLNWRKDEHIALFVCHQNGYPIERLQPDDVRRAMRRISRKTGITIRPHMCRKTAGTKLWHNGADIRVVQDYLRHERPQTTQIYVGPNDRRIREAQAEFLNYRADDTGTVATEHWSKEHDQCIGCGRTDRTHAAHGYCYTCYMAVKRGKLEVNLGS